MKMRNRFEAGSILVTTTAARSEEAVLFITVRLEFKKIESSIRKSILRAACPGFAKAYTLGRPKLNYLRLVSRLGPFVVPQRFPAPDQSCSDRSHQNSSIVQLLPGTEPRRLN
jgi:hypothetical protein